MSEPDTSDPECTGVMKAEVSSDMGVQRCKISTKYLHSNGTSHTWAFSAIAEFIDNAHDPGVDATELFIDKVCYQDQPCLVIRDNGKGMDTDKHFKMLSFGFSDKEIYETQGDTRPIGQYGNGFKSGSMRLGKDALVFTRCEDSASVGFLSQTYNGRAENVDESIFVPIVEYRIPSLERIKNEASRNNLNAILEYSVFKEEKEIRKELHSLGRTGTKIVIFNLQKEEGFYELDFESDPNDIRCPETSEVDPNSLSGHRYEEKKLEYKQSLRQYCSILYMCPKVLITLRKQKVRTKYITRSLANMEVDFYRPTWTREPIKIYFGFSCGRYKFEDYGMMLYYRNRLIKAFEKVGCQNQRNEMGVGVIGAVELDMLTPIHNKQDFKMSKEYFTLMMNLGQKLNDYWKFKVDGAGGSTDLAVNTNLPLISVQCDKCNKWRRLPDDVAEPQVDKWYCYMNRDSSHNRCEIEQEPEGEDAAVKPTYKKRKKRLSQGKRKQCDDADVSEDSYQGEEQKKHVKTAKYDKQADNQEGNEQLRHFNKTRPPHPKEASMTKINLRVSTSASNGTGKGNKKDDSFIASTSQRSLSQDGVNFNGLQNSTPSRQPMAVDAYTFNNSDTEIEETLPEVYFPNVSNKEMGIESEVDLQTLHEYTQTETSTDPDAENLRSQLKAEKDKRQKLEVDLEDLRSQLEVEQEGKRNLETNMARINAQVEVERLGRHNLRSNIITLLSLICPDIELPGEDGIEEMITNMIAANDDVLLSQ